MCIFALFNTCFCFQRKNIVNGQYEPTDEESHWLSDEEEEGGEDKEEKDEEEVSQLSVSFCLPLWYQYTNSPYHFPVISSSNSYKYSSVREL